MESTPTVPHAEQTNRLVRIAARVTTAASCVVILLAAQAFAFQLTTLGILGAAVASVVCAQWMIPRSRTHLPREFFALRRQDAALLPILILDACILTILWTHRTDAAIASPWNILPIGIFVLFFAASGMLLWAFPRLSAVAQIMALICHAAVMFGVSVAVYQLGFGYDPFIHQAAEKHLAEYGFLDPRRVLYLGQYALVAALARITGFSVHAVDVALVPLLASIAVPAAFLLRFSGRRALVFFGMTYPFFTFTVPYQLSVMCLLMLVLLGGYFKKTGAYVAAILLAIAAVIIHPLAGIPSLAFAASLLLPERVSALWRTIAACVLTGGGIIVAFAVQAVGVGGSVALPNADTLHMAALVLFGNPYAQAPASWLASAYALFRWFPLVWILVGIYGYVRKDGWRAFAHPPVGVAIGIFLAAIFLAGHVRLPDILPGEQFEYALRLMALLPVFFIEGVALAIPRLPRYRAVRGAVLFIAAPLATVQWYLSYPQSNTVSSFSANGMGQEEVNAVRAIQTDAASKLYVVLAYPMMSVAALQEFGFERTLQTPWGTRYFYPIPTGNELYGLYTQLLDSPVPASHMPTLFSVLPVDVLYVAVPAEWDPEQVIDQRLSAFAHHTWSIPPRIRVYAFER
jgi:hypothetical protein